MKTLMIERGTASSLPVRCALVAALGGIAIALSPVQSSVAYGQTYTVLADFSGTNGSGPRGNLTLGPDGSTLYGTAWFGGLSYTGTNSTGNGTIFSISTDGSSGIRDLYNVSGGTVAGNSRAHPTGTLTLSGTTLYGMTNTGGTLNGAGGTIFSISTTGAVFNTLTTFNPASGPTSFGNDPYGSLTLSGTTLYGMTSQGKGSGNLFSARSSGGAGTNLVSFSNSPGAGAGCQPVGDLTLSGSTLYGTTSAGSGAVGGHNGTIFSYNLTSSSYQNLYSFTGGADGANPYYGSLVLSGSTLYGTTTAGGANGDGVIFSYNLTTSAFQTLVSFSGSTGSYLGASPYGGLTLVGSTLYGMTDGGPTGAAGAGNIFSYNLTSSAYNNLYSFSGGTDGGNPAGGLIRIGSTLYGTAGAGGTTGAAAAGGVPGDGVVFALALPAEWATNGSGTWSGSGNWTGGIAPGGSPMDTAVFGNVLTGGTAATVTLDSSMTLSALSFGTTGGASYVITPSNGSTLTLADNAAGAATISNSGGNHTIAAPIALGSSLSVTATTGSTLTVSGAISEINAGTTLSVSGGGTLVLSGSNTYSGGTTVDASTLQIGSGGSGEYLTSPSVTMSNNATLAFSHSNTLIYSGSISGSGQVTEQGGGVLILSGSNTYSGGTTVNASTLQIGNGGTGEALSSSGGITLSNNATVEFNHSDTYPGGYSGAISGSGQFVKAGSGSLTLNGANSYTGPTTISAGTLALGGVASGPGSNLPTTTALSIAAAARSTWAETARRWAASAARPGQSS